MDSLDFYREAVLGDLYDRAASDAMLTRCLLWIGKWAPPEYVYAPEKLDAWAAKNGYTRTHDTAEIAALLRKVVPKVEAYDPLAQEINDAIYRYG